MRTAALLRASLFVSLSALASPLAFTGCSHSSASGPTARICTIAAPTPGDWRLRPDGTLLRDGLGRIVALRGVDAGGRSKLAPYAPFDYADGGYASTLDSYMDRAASWGIDVLRVPFVWEAVDPTAAGDDDADFLSRYDALLDAAWARGIWSVIDFHQDVYSQSFCGDGFPPWTLVNPPAAHHDCPSWPLEYNDPTEEAAFDTFWTPTSDVQTQFQALWQRLVTRYANKPGVLGFEPINEPSSGSANAATWEAKTLSAFYSTIAAQMNAAAPSSLVFIDLSGPDGAVVSTNLTKPTGSNLVFAPHYYPIIPDPTQVQSGLATWSAMGQAWNVPTFVGEFGIKGDGDTVRDFMAAHFAALDALGIGGSEWEYSVSALSWNNEGFSVVDADGGEHEQVQAIARPYARAVAGSGVTQSWDPTAVAFALSYAPAAGAASDASAGSTTVSVVSLPARAFASGYDVSLTGGCYDVTSAPGEMLIQSDPGATGVTLAVTSR